jgi:hypothetical protein
MLPVLLFICFCPHLAVFLGVLITMGAVLAMASVASVVILVTLWDAANACDPAHLSMGLLVVLVMLTSVVYRVYRPTP